MLPSHILTQHVNDNGFSIEGNADTTIKFIASNLKTAHRWTHDYCGFQSSLNFCSSRDTSGIVILNVRHWIVHGKNRSPEQMYITLEVCEGKVKLSNYWEPKMFGRSIAVKEIYCSPDAHIEVVSENDQRYSTNPDCNPGEWYLPDETLLCRYVVGEVEEGELKNVAMRRLEETTASETIPGLESQITDLEALVEKLQKKLAIQDDSAKVGWAKFEAARKTVSAMYDQLKPALPLIKRFQGKLYCRVKTAIRLADAELPKF